MLKRSPILGYNHNVRHRGLVFHVQTEDSGVDNPHLFSHLFHGGVILSTRRLDYDRDSDENVVKSLMQSQHKALLKELKAGRHDEKIDLYLGDHPELEPAARATDVMPAVADTSVTDQVAPVIDASTTQEIAALGSEPSTPMVVIEENSQVTIRIEQPLVQEAARSSFEMPEIEASVPLEVPPAPAAASTASPPRVGSQTIGLGSAMMGKAQSLRPVVPGPAPRPGATPPPTRPAAAATPPPTRPAAPPAAGAAPPPPAAAPPPAERRPEPGSIEFRPAPRGADGAPVTRVEFRKPALSAESELSAAFRAIRLDELGDVGTTEPASAVPAVVDAEPVTTPTRAAPEAPNLYIHTRAGRSTTTPESVEDEPTGRLETFPKRGRAAGPSARAGTAAPPPVPDGPRGGGRGAVVVSRPSVIVGTPSRPSEPRPAPRRARESNRPGLFGKDLISEKSLDEVILAYLSEDGEDGGG